MHDPLRVLLDVTHLGIVQASPRHSFHRAGIHRVIEQTARSLGAMSDVALTLCSPEHPASSLDYAQEHAELRAFPFAIPARKRFGSRLAARVVARYQRAGGHTVAALPARAANSLVLAANRVLDVPSGGVGVAPLARADVFHSPVYALPARRSRRRGVQYFLTVYDVIPFLHPEFSSWGGDAWLRRVLGTLGPDDHVLAISERTREDLLTARPDLAPDRVRVTYLAADRERFYPCRDAARTADVRSRYGIPDVPYLLSVGTLEPRKNVAHLVRSFAAAARAERLGDLHLVLTGGRGWDYETIEAEIGRLDGLRDRVVFTGYVDDADLAPLYSGALAFAYPSLYEGFGLPPLEAMQCGTPVIASSTSSLPEVVGDAGLLVDPRDADALAGAILSMYADAGLRADLARRALARAREFSWDRYARQTVAAYRAAL